MGRMALSRSWIFRISVAGNLFVLVYLALYSASTSSPSSSGGNVTPSSYATNSPQDIPVANAIRSSKKPIEGLPISGEVPLQPKEESNKVLSNEGGEQQQQQPQQVVVRGGGLGHESVLLAHDEEKESKTGNGGGGGGGGGEVVDFESNQGNLNEAIQEQWINDSAALALQTLKNRRPDGDKIFPCDDYTPRTYYGQRGTYWVLYNYFKGTKQFRCDQSITYTTHADWTFLDNLVPLLERWQGPLSLAVYSPGTDFEDTFKRIQYLRECSNNTLVKEYVTFHLFFDQRHIPKMKIPHNPGELPVNCAALQNVTYRETLQTYKKSKHLIYPVNVARNVAREMATTHYVFPSDIELYPNPNLIPDFLEMIRRNDTMLQRPAPKVFVASIFEVEANVTALPYDKRELIYMLQNKSAIPFHKYVCADCHRIPKANEWLKANFEQGMRVFHIGKRHKPYHHWEPIFIGTKFDPMYDERLSWEGRSDKMTQGYVLCVLDYEFHILDNAFLVHRPGIKRKKVIPKKNPVVAKQNSLIAKTILPELKQIYGTKPGCYV